MKNVRSRRSFWLALVFLGLMGSFGPRTLRAADSTLLSDLQLERFGLTRAWFTQIDLDRSRSRVVGVTLDRGALFVQTDRALLQALDAETGRTLWETLVGHPEHPCTEPGANAKYVAVVNGSRLYVLDRPTGNQKWDRQMRGGPGAGPALTKTRVYVPMISGRIESYELEDYRRPPWVYASAGRALIQPVATADSVSWPTDLGFLYVGRSEDPAIRFRLETDFSISSPPGYLKPYLYASSLDGYVYSVHEITGNHRWRFSAGDPVSESPVVIQDRVYVCADRGGMYCINAETGREIWWATGVARFLAATPERVLGTDRVGKLMVLDAKTGANLGNIPIHGLSIFLVNGQTDRVYLASDTGLIQCVRDAKLAQPLKYVVADKEEDDKAPKDEKPKGAAEGAAPADDAPQADPFGEEAGGDTPVEGEAPADDAGPDAGGADPFGDAGGDEAPAADGGEAADDDPFAQ